MTLPSCLFGRLRPAHLHQNGVGEILDLEEQGPRLHKKAPRVRGFRVFGVFRGSLRNRNVHQAAGDYDYLADGFAF